MAILTDLIIGILIQLYQIFGNLGWAIITFTIIVRTLLLPLTLKSLRAAKEMQKLQPELNKLKQKHGKDKAKLQQAQMELYKNYNINPLAGCLPQIVQIGLLILLYQVLINFLGQTEINGIAIEPHFFWLDLSQPDPLYILPVAAGVTQMIMSLMIAPGAEIPDVVSNTSKKKSVQKANEKEEDIADMASSMQKQMIYFMPVMTGFIALRFPSGLALYWVATTVYSIAQQYAITGPGGLVTYYQRARQFVNSKIS